MARRVPTHCRTPDNAKFYHFKYEINHSLVQNSSSVIQIHHFSYKIHPLIPENAMFSGARPARERCAFSLLYRSSRQRSIVALGYLSASLPASQPTSVMPIPSSSGRRLAVTAPQTGEGPPVPSPSLRESPSKPLPSTRPKRASSAQAGGSTDGSTPPSTRSGQNRLDGFE